MTPKKLSEKMLKRITKNRYFLYDDNMDDLIWKIINRYSFNPYATKKHMPLDVVEGLYIGVFESKYGVRVGLKNGLHCVRYRGGQWVSMEEFKKGIEIGKLEIEEIKCKRNKSLINKLKKERLKWLRLQQQAT